MFDDFEHGIVVTERRWCEEKTLTLTLTLTMTLTLTRTLTLTLGEWCGISQHIVPGGRWAGTWVDDAEEARGRLPPGVFDFVWGKEGAAERALTALGVPGIGLALANPNPHPTPNPTPNPSLGVPAACGVRVP